MDASFKITRREIGAAYDAGRDAVVALIEDLIEQFISMLKRQEQRIGALEQELQELKKDSHDSGKPPSRDSFERKQQKRRVVALGADRQAPAGRTAGASWYDAAPSGESRADHDPPSRSLRVWQVAR